MLIYLKLADHCEGLITKLELNVQLPGPDEHFNKRVMEIGLRVKLGSVEKGRCVEPNFFRILPASLYCLTDFCKFFAKMRYKCESMFQCLVPFFH